jgi:hypothetical protein
MGGGAGGEEDLPMGLSTGGEERLGAAPVANREGVLGFGARFGETGEEAREDCLGLGSESVHREGPAVARSQSGGLQPDEGTADGAGDFLGGGPGQVVNAFLDQD